MKINIFFVTLAGAALAFVAVGCGLSASPHVRHVDVKEFMQVVQDSSVVVVDVRTCDEFAAGCIPGTKLNIDVMETDFKNQVEEKIPRKSVVAIYCRSGNRSKRAGRILSEMGYEVIELDNGYKEWLKYNKR